MFLIKVGDGNKFMVKEDYLYLEDRFTSSWMSCGFSAKPFIYASKQSAQAVVDFYIKSLENDVVTYTKNQAKLEKDLQKYETQAKNLEEKKKEILDGMQTKPMAEQLVDFEAYKSKEAELTKIKPKIVDAKKYIKNNQNWLDAVIKTLEEAKGGKYITVMKIVCEPC